ncbi:MAG: sigma-70 family RNA polymerase sigma factor [Planctomycetes bacterium]|nr:sigma-70 family RNA polymerase sigma factor [Planctomycetota bacterium]
MDSETAEAVSLMQRCAQGDELALAALYDRWAGPVLSFVERMCRDRAQAEDMVQETFVRVWRAAPRYEPTAKFSTWLFQIARNAWLNEREKQLRRPMPMDLDSPEATSGSVPSPAAPLSGSPDRLALDRELGERIEAAVQKLPDKLREVWVLGAAQGLPYQDVAAILEIPVGTVKSRMFQAVRLLRSDLEPYVA